MTAKSNLSRFTDPRLERIFNLEELPEVTLAIKEDDWNRLLTAFDEAPGENFWIPGDFIFRGSNSIPDQTVSNRAYFGIYKLREFIEDEYLENRKAYFGDDQPGERIHTSLNRCCFCCDLWSTGGQRCDNHYC